MAWLDGPRNFSLLFFGGFMPTVTWKAVSTVLAILLVWVSASLIRVENQRYALTVGMCASPAPLQVPDLACLKRVETRTGWWWHLYYAMWP